MSIPLAELLNLVSVGDPITCTLSPESVQVIFYALTFLEDDDAWLDDAFDTISDAERQQITELLEGVSEDIIP